MVRRVAVPDLVSSNGTRAPDKLLGTSPVQFEPDPHEFNFPGLNPIIAPREGFHPDVEPIGDTGIHATPDAPADPTDCDRLPGSPFCGGSISDPREGGVTPSISYNDCEICVTLTPTFGFELRSGTVCYRNPNCTNPGTSLLPLPPPYLPQPPEEIKDSDLVKWDVKSSKAPPGRARILVARAKIEDNQDRNDRKVTFVPGFSGWAGNGTNPKVPSFCWDYDPNAGIAGDVVQKNPGSRWLKGGANTITDFIPTNMGFQFLDCSSWQTIEIITVMEGCMNKNEWYTGQIDGGFTVPDTYGFLTDLVIAHDTYALLDVACDDSRLATFFDKDTGLVDLDSPLGQKLKYECSRGSDIVHFVPNPAYPGYTIDQIIYPDWRVIDINYDSCPKSIEHPPDDDDMACCFNSSGYYNEQLLAVVLQKVEDLEAELAEIRQNTRDTKKAVGVDDLPASLPVSLLADRKGETQAKSLVDLFGWFVRQYDATIGEFPIELEFTDIDPTTKGNQTKKVKLPNLAESVAEMYALSVKNCVDSDMTVNFLTRMVAELMAIKTSSIVTQDYARANASYLGYKGSDAERKVPSAFNPHQLGSLEDLLTESESKIVGWQCDDKDSVAEYLQKLMFSAGIIKTVFMRTGKDFNRLKDEVERMWRLNGIEEDSADRLWEEFLRVLNSETGVFNQDQVVKPHIRDLHTGSDGTPNTNKG